MHQEKCAVCVNMHRWRQSFTLNVIEPDVGLVVNLIDLQKMDLQALNMGL